MIQSQTELPEYVSRSVGKPDLSSLANRAMEMAAFCMENNLPDAAGYFAQAHGSLSATMAASAHEAIRS